MRKIEIAAFNVESALNADQAGADRIEFCSGWKEGGLTPEEEDVKFLLNEIKTPMTLMIRPRGGDFNYSDEEFNQMKESVKTFSQYPILGFVFGILDQKNELDIQRNQELIELAGDKICVIHRSFDKTSDMVASLVEVINLGFHSILTSGHAANVEAGLQNLKELKSLAAGRIEIMPGGGLRSENVATIEEACPNSYYHSSAILDSTGIADMEEIKKLKGL